MTMNAPHHDDDDALPVQPLAPIKGGDTDDGAETELIFALADLSEARLPDDPEAMLAQVEMVADAHGVDADMLLTALEQPALMREVRAKARLLRQQGESLKHRAIPILERAVDQAGRLIDENAVSPAVLPRLMDTLLKVTGLAEERAARLRAAEGTTKGPIVHLHILRGDDPMPDIPKGDLALTFIAPDWTGDRKERVVSTQDGGGHG